MSVVFEIEATSGIVVGLQQSYSRNMQYITVPHASVAEDRSSRQVCKDLLSLLLFQGRQVQLEIQTQDRGVSCCLCFSPCILPESEHSSSLRAISLKAFLVPSTMREMVVISKDPGYRYYSSLKHEFRRLRSV